MNFKLLLSLVIITGMIFINSCGEEKQPELDTVDSVDALIEEMDSVENAQPDSVVVDEVTIAETPAEETKAEAGSEKPAAATETVAAAKPGDYTTKPLEGTIVSLNSLVMGGDGKVSKADAQALVSKGNLVLFKATNGTVYFVYNEDGTFAGKRLAGYANNAKVGLLGKSKVVDGTNVFIMTLIEGM